MKEERSLFFPLALIAAGVLWLMINFGYIPTSNLWALTRLWPLFLIGGGLSLILHGYSKYAGMLISILMVVVAVVAVIFAPQLGLESPGWHWNWDAGGSVGGSGEIVTEERSVGDFTSIDLDYPAEVTITQGDAYSVSVTADDNLLPQLETNVDDGELQIRNSERNFGQRVNPSETVVIVITVVDLSAVRFDSAGSLTIDGYSGDALQIELNGAGKISLNDLEVTNLDLQLDGAGSLEASGSAAVLVVDLDGLGSLSAGALAVQTARVTVDGAGSATVRVEDRLEVFIDGLGSVNYYGSPRSWSKLTGLVPSIVLASNHLPSQRACKECRLFFLLTFSGQSTILVNNYTINL
jgi:hypothetical protein